MRTVTLTIVAFILCIPTILTADEYHYINMLIGDRASGMGGAYVAIADDPSGLYYNPAGIAFAATPNISGSMNAVHITQTRYSDVLGGKDWTRESSALLPNFFGIIQPFGPGTLGFSYAVTNAELEDQDQRFSGIPSPGVEFIINTNNQDTTFNIGPSYAVSFNETFSIGLTLYGFMREQEVINNQNFDFPDVTFDMYHWENHYLHQREIGIKPVFGIMLSPIPKISLGFSASKITLLSAQQKSQYTCASNYDSIPSDSLCTQNELVVTNSTSYYQRLFPWTVNLGLAYFASESVLVSGTVYIYEAINGQSKPLMNFNAGLEYYLFPTLAMRAGVYTNYANTPQLVAGKANQAEHIDMFGASFSLSHFTRSNSITVGINGSLGKGKAQVIAGNTEIQDAIASSLTMFVSASSSF